MMVLSAALDLNKETLTGFRDSLKNILRKKTTAEQKSGLEMVLNAICEMRIICRILDSLGSNMKYSFRTFLYSCLETYNGFCFQYDISVISDSTNSKKKCCRGKCTILAVGGRYDDLISSLAQRNPINELSSNHPFNPGAVGLSIEFEKLVCLALDEELTSKGVSKKYTSSDIVIVSCPVSSNDKEKCQILFNESSSLARTLRQSGIRVIQDSADLHTLESLHQKCRDEHIRAALILREDLENRNDITARLISYDKNEKTSERKIVNYSHREVLETVKQILNDIPISYSSDCGPNKEKLNWQASRDSSGEGNPLTNSNSSSSNLMQSMTGGQSTVSGGASSLAAALDIQFHCFEGKLQSHVRRRHEAAICSLLTNAFCVSSTVNQCCFIHVIAVELPFKIVKAIVNEVDLEEDDVKLRKSLDSCLFFMIDKYPRYRKHIPPVLEDIFLLKTVKKVNAITFFSFPDNKFVTVT
jgi:hypothetical protein